MTGKVILFYVPENHNRAKYEKRFGRPASLTPPRLRGRELQFPSGKPTSHTRPDEHEQCVQGRDIA
jgi:hypothetical protein